MLFFLKSNILPNIFNHQNHFRDEKIENFRQEIQPRKAIHLLMLTTYGVKQNKYYGIVQNEVSMDDLFNL